MKAQLKKKIYKTKVWEGKIINNKFILRGKKSIKKGLIIKKVTTPILENKGIQNYQILIKTNFTQIINAVIKISIKN